MSRFTKALAKAGKQFAGALACAAVGSGLAVLMVSYPGLTLVGMALAVFVVLLVLAWKEGK